MSYNAIDEVQINRSVLTDNSEVYDVKLISDGIIVGEFNALSAGSASLIRDVVVNHSTTTDSQYSVL